MRGTFASPGWATQSAEISSPIFLMTQHQFIEVLEHIVEGEGDQLCLELGLQCLEISNLFAEIRVSEL